ncbi:Carboxylesterase NlhH [Maioricimonas rarisocia]|uniref:Carboxylesterase NlhH n=1 Tax=Maioricimonas rarisocia TaxID=2528026 RepID=A0A517ZCH0_9PLAN|nr:alpha/beta hydrolase [Maioricimonas rarisocia]QDU40155.1 Carboxylesterase NlhH [Maioricimonas rarisocia]
MATHRTFRCLIVTLLLIPATAFAQVTSENDPRLKRWLERFPAADADKDGVLTEAEARAYRDRGRTQGRRRGDNRLPAPTHADVSYGPHERNILDVWLAEGDEPTPLLIYIHGGGFVGGNKRTFSPQVLQGCLDSGISVAAIHYRFVTTDPFPAPQHDAARAVQFLRSKAKEWNLDPQRVAAFGGSAGAGLSMWLGFHDDLADTESEDPVARQSTRLVAVGSRGGQSSYDPAVIREWVGGRAHEHPSIYKCYDVASLDELDDPGLQPLYDEVSAITHLTADDPPVWMFYNEPNRPLPADARPGQGIHHPIFGLKLKAAMDELRIENVYRHASEFRGDRDADMLEFFRRHLLGDSPAEAGS